MNNAIRKLALSFVVIVAMATPSALAQESICSRVKIEIKQELTLERQGFDAKMVINNGLPDSALTDVNIEVNFTDAVGNPVLATSNPNHTNAMFFIRVDTLENIADVSGDGTIQAGKEAEIHWLIVPAPGTGGADPQGRMYNVGATLTYMLSGEQKTVEVTPDYIYVAPMPHLTLDYFLPEDVYGDDAFSDAIEPPVPFGLGVRVKNTGFGPAHELKIESGQPRIVENEQGLLIGFRITGSEVNERPANKSLLVNLGTIDPTKSSVARWVMECTLTGEFVDFDAYFTHDDSLGGELTSLIKSVDTHLLVHDVLVDLSGRDAVRDFLARDADILRVYESSGVDTETAEVSETSTLVSLGMSGSNQNYRFSAPVTTGPWFAKVRLPEGASLEYSSAVRGDGKLLHAANVWISQERVTPQSPWDYYLNVFDVNGGGDYALSLRERPVPVQAPPVLHYVGKKATRVGQQLGFYIQATDPNGTIPLLAGAPLSTGASLTNNGDGTASFRWTPISGQEGVHLVRFSATDGEFTDWEVAKLFVGQVGEAFCGDVPCSLANWGVKIQDLLALSESGTSTVKWESVEGVGYDLYVSDEPFSGNMAWNKVAGQISGAPGQEAHPDEQLGTNRMRRFYKVTVEGESPDTNGVWGVIRTIARTGYTMMSAPLRTDLRFDGDFGAALAEQLVGDNGGVGDGVGDEIYILEPSGAWRVLYLDGAGVWKESSGQPSVYTLHAGQGFFLARNSTVSARVTMAGAVGNDGTLTNQLVVGWNMIGVSEGKSLPLKETLATAGPVGGASEETADLLVLQNPNGSWRRMMYVQGWGAPYDENWFDLSTFQITTNRLEPGAAYYYLRRSSGGATSIRF